MNTKLQLAARITGAVAGLGVVGTLAYYLRATWCHVGYLYARDGDHCAEIGELQEHVAVMARALEGGTAIELPYGTRAYASRMLDA